MWTLKTSINIQYKCCSFILFINSANIWGTLYWKQNVNNNKIPDLQNSRASKRKR